MMVDSTDFLFDCSTPTTLPGNLEQRNLSCHTTASSGDEHSLPPPQRKIRISTIANIIESPKSE
jgi:hypothetical protein